MRKIYLAALGCPKNQIDAELMLGRAEADGDIVVDDPRDADVVVVNTCAFIEAAREESIETILGLAALPGAERRRLVVTGCMAERYGEELARAIPEIDSLVGTGALDRFGEAMDARGGTLFRAGKHYLPSAAMERRITERDGSAYLKVSEGCDHECSFCVIPSFRGRHESRTVDDIAAEAERLAAAGIVEVNLIAQDLSAYGRDLGLKDGLAGLLWRLGRVPGLARVRCFYLYPSTLTDSALEAVRDVDNVVPWIDMPLQHADSAVLQAMRRHRDTGQVWRIIERIRRILPEAYLRSSFITGFPGETPEAFERLLRFVEEAQFDRISAFAWSPEEGSPAADLSGRVDSAEGERRRDLLLSVQEPISALRLARVVGTRQRVLVAGRDPDSGWFGRSDLQAPDIDGVTWLDGDREGALGRLLEAEVTGADGIDLFATAGAAC